MDKRPKNRPGIILAVIVVLFLGRIAQWCLSEFWYDETLSLLLFVLKPQSLAEVFRSYQIANNHILSNAIEWLWLRMGGGGISFAEEMVRLPAVAAAVGTLLVTGLSWRRLLGEQRALTAAALMAASPVFCGFAWQMRGYSLAIFLAALTVTAAACRLDRPTTRNGIALFCSSLLMPLVMPSAAMLPCAVALAMACTAYKVARKPRIWPAVLTGALPFAGAFCGVAYYLTLWEKFVYASHEAGGWVGFWRTLGGIAGPFLLHGVVPLLAAALLAWRKKKSGHLSLAGDDDSRQTMRTYGLWLALSSAVAIVAVLVLRIPEGRYPFPRVFLPLLPAVTFALAMMPLKEGEGAKAHFVQLALIFAVGLGTGWLADGLNDVSLRAGVTRQNLLCQYYRGKEDNRQLASRVVEEYFFRDGKSVLMIVPGIDGPSMQFYLSSMTGNQPVPWHLATGVEHYDALMLQEARRNNACVMLSARNEAEARKMLAECGWESSMPWSEWKQVASTGFRLLWEHHLY